MKVIVVDDNAISAQKALDVVLSKQGRRDDFTFVPVMHPEKVPRAIKRNPDAIAVLVDMHFDKTNHMHSGLTALDFLSSSGNPPAIGFSQTEGSKPLFKYAACQLISRPPVDWVSKNSKDYPRLIQTLDMISRGEMSEESESLQGCYLDDSVSGRFVEDILTHQYDARLWRYLATTNLDYKELAKVASINTRSAVKRVEEYYYLAARFEGATQEEGENLLDISDIESHRDPAGQRKADIEDFASENSLFFTAPDLEEIVRKRSIERQRGRK